MEKSDTIVIRCWSESKGRVLWILERQSAFKFRMGSNNVLILIDDKLVWLTIWIFPYFPAFCGELKVTRANINLVIKSWSEIWSSRCNILALVRIVNVSWEIFQRNNGPQCVVILSLEQLFPFLNWHFILQCK